MEIISGIYKITSPSNRIYIGQSKNIYDRWKNHKKSINSKHKSKLINSFKKYGYENHVFEIIHICNIEKLNEFEKHYVDLFKTLDSEHGLNLRDGGGNKATFSVETRRKQSDSAKRRKRNNINWKCTDEQRKANSNAQKLAWIIRKENGTSNVSKEGKKNMSKAKIGNKNAMGYKMNSDRLEKHRIMCLEREAKKRLDGRNKVSEETKRKISKTLKATLKKRQLII